jgi:hypothetical protein
VRNSTGSEKTIIEAWQAGWIFKGDETGLYAYENNMFNLVCEDEWVCPDYTNISPSKSYFIWSNKDNLTIIRQN